jgi:hypothetical protein
MVNFYKNNRTRSSSLTTILTLLICLAVGFAFMEPCFAQDAKKGAKQAAKKNADKLSQELVNPIGPNWLINTYLNVMEKRGDITDETDTYVEWLIQPVMPIPLNKKTGLILMNRPALPIFFKDPVPTMDAMGNFSGLDDLSGIGDLNIQTALGKMAKTDFGKVMWGVGSVLIFPTATEDGSGAEKYSAGPVGMMVAFTKEYSFGAMLNHVWSYAGNDNREDVNQTQFQLFYYKQLGNGWQIGDNPTWTIKSHVDSGEKYNIPIGFGVYKTTYIMGMAWRFGITSRYNLKSFDRWGSDWGVSFTITPVIKNPFM